MSSVSTESPVEQNLNVTEIIKPECDNKEYHVLQLDNIKVILIYDASATLAALSASVGSGSLACEIGKKKKDEDEGVAHFLEHILFEGDEEAIIDFQALIAECGGYTNAFTAEEMTVYMATFKMENFSKVIVAFILMFIRPKFDVQQSENEKTAVDDEYKKNRLDDEWREMEVIKQLINMKNPEHPYGKNFGCGTAKTLKDVDKETVTAYYRKHYKHQPIVVSILSSKPLSDVVDVLKMFTAMSTDNVRIEIHGNPFECLRGEKIDIVSLREQDVLKYNFVMDPVYFDPSGGDLEPLIALINDQGGLFTHLNKAKLASSVRCYLSENMSFGAVMTIRVELTTYATEDGEEGHFKEVDAIVIGYLQNLHKMFITDKDGPEKTKTHIEYVKRYLKSNFKFSNPSDAFDTVENIVVAADRHPDDPENILIDNFSLSTEHATAWFVKALNCLMVSNMFCTFISRRHIKNPTKVEKWFGTSWDNNPFVGPTEEQLVNIMNDPATRVFELEHLLPTVEGCKILENVQDYTEQKGGVFVYIKHKPQFKKPMVIMNVKLILNKQFYPDGFDDNELFVRMNVCHLVNSFLKRKMSKYKRIMSGYSIGVSKDGFSCFMTCFTEHTEQMLDEAMKIFKDFIKMDFNPSLLSFILTWFTQSMQFMAKETANERLCQPFQQSAQDFSLLVMKGENTVKEQVKTILSLDSVGFDWIKKLWKNGKRGNFGLKILVEGNITKKLKSMIINHIKEYSRQEVPIEDLYCPALNIWNKKVTSRDKATSELELNSAVIYVRPMGCSDLLKEVILEVFNAMMGQDFFDTLRSKKKMGYIVLTRISSIHGRLFHHCIVQSPNFPPTKITEEIEKYLESFDKKVCTNEQEILLRINNRQKQLKEEFKNLAENFEFDWAEIDSYRLNFESKQKKIEILENIKADPKGFINILLKIMELGRPFCMETFAPQFKELMNKWEDNQHPVEIEQIGITKEVKIRVEDDVKPDKSDGEKKEQKKTETPLIVRTFPTDNIIRIKPGMGIEVC